MKSKVFINYIPNKTENERKKEYVLKEIRPLIYGREFMLDFEYITIQGMNLLRNLIERTYEFCHVEVELSPQKLVIYTSNMLMRNIESNFKNLLLMWNEEINEMFIKLDKSELKLLMANDNYLFNKFKKCLKERKQERLPITMEKKLCFGLYFKGKMRLFQVMNGLFQNFRLLVYFSAKPDERRNYPHFASKDQICEEFELASIEPKVLTNFIVFMEKGKWIYKGEKKLQKMKSSKYYLGENISTKKERILVESNLEFIIW